MKRIISTLGLMIGGVLALGLMVSQVSAASPTLTLSDASGDPGDEVTVNLAAGDIGAPGLGAWSIDIAYDPRVVTPVSCSNPSSQIAVCNTEFSSNSVRISGASAEGITGSFALGSVTFSCDAVGESPLNVRNRDFMDATPVNLQPIDVQINHGAIGCGVDIVLPVTGAQDPAGGNTVVALIAALIAFAVVTGVSGTVISRRS